MATDQDAILFQVWGRLISGFKEDAVNRPIYTIFANVIIILRSWLLMNLGGAEWQP